jgi:(1->4)-alpha-D-glucan 1-alpha-D-glucosylmutase
MGLVIDIVPNHMAIGPANRWWWDVLEHGLASPHASYFDVDWDPPEARLRNVILLPVLADHYGRVLESGALALRRDGAVVTVAHGEQRFPVDPSTLGPVLADAATRSGSDELAFVARALGELPPSTSTARADTDRRGRDAAVLRERLADLLRDPGVGAAVDAALAGTNADHDRLDALLEDQNYRLAFWRAASRDLGYRRFFDIDTLVGLRVESDEVFGATHRLVLERVAAGDVSGLRIDHPDGLRDPAEYFGRLRDAAPDAWIVAEKILAPGEELPPWPVDGTTGYGFANLVARVQVDPAAEGPLTEVYARRAGVRRSWEAIETDARLAALDGSLGSDLNRLGDLWLGICEANRRYRDFTRHDLHEALREVAAAFRVYRTYVRDEPRHVSDTDRRVVGDATRLAAERRPDLDPDLFTFLAAILLLEVPGRLPAELAMRFQQLTPAAMAKGVEDTAFYRYGRLVALNEVGGDPGQFSVDPAAFHVALAEEGRRLPHAMLASSTHDTKRSEDVRARLVAISEDPAGWDEAVERLANLAERHRAGDDPDPHDAYLLFQALVGAWPIDADRAAGYLRKAAREAKERTSWTAPDEAYESALDAFVNGCLADERFVARLERTVEDLVAAGRANSLAGLLWKLTAPGVPDIYQGTELWDLSLVDPDNRRPIDFARRADLLSEGRAPAAAIATDAAGATKQWLVQQALALRARRPADLAGDAAYVPLEARGPAADHVIGFRRGDGVVAVAPRLVRRLAATGGWRGTTLALPAGRWSDVLDGREHAGAVTLASLLDGPRVALLERVG